MLILRTHALFGGRLRTSTTTTANLLAVLLAAFGMTATAVIAGAVAVMAGWLWLRRHHPIAATWLGLFVLCIVAAVISTPTRRR